MNIELIVIGKTDSKEVAALVEQYARRVNFYCKFAVTTLPDVRNTKSMTVKQQRTAEGEAILREEPLSPCAEENVAGDDVGEIAK